MSEIKSKACTNSGSSAFLMLASQSQHKTEARVFRFTQKQRRHQSNGGQAGRQVERWAVGCHIDCARDHQIISSICQD